MVLLVEILLVLVLLAGALLSAYVGVPGCVAAPGWLWC